MRIAAHRVFRNAQGRAEHARFGQAARHRVGQREHEKSRGAELRRKRGQSREVRLELLELVGAAHTDEQPGAGAAHDAQRTAGIDIAGGERERVEHGEPLAIVELAAERRCRLAHGNAARRAFAPHFDVDDAGFLPLADPPPAAGRTGIGTRQHVVRGHRGVADEAGLGARREETHAQLVIGAIRLEHEGGICIVELARDGEHFRVAKRIGVQHHARRISRETLGGEGVDLENADAAAHSGREFYPQTYGTQGAISAKIRPASGWRVRVHRPEMRMGREPVEPDPVNTGGGIGMHGSLRALGAICGLFVCAAATAAPDSTDPSSLDEVVVTAELRDRSLRDLPASATVLDSHTLEIAGVEHLQDVLNLVPNLNWAAGTSRPRFFQLRGIGELEQWQGAPNPSVGFLIDGIDFSGVGMPATLSDVDRVEVLRGPQGTAYGANALAGLIAVNTRAPQRESEIHADMTFGDYGTVGASG